MTANERDTAGGVVGLLLAGGLSRRMGGGDKTLRLLGGRTILDHILERVRPQVKLLVLNANGDPARFAGTGLPVAPDVVPDYAGPLAGVLTGLDWAAEHAPGARWVATFATDAPFQPTDLVERLLAAVECQGADMACARSSGREHPVFGLWPVHLRHDLRCAMLEETCIDSEYTMVTKLILRASKKVNDHHTVATCNRTKPSPDVWTPRALTDQDGKKFSCGR